MWSLGTAGVRGEGEGEGEGKEEKGEGEEVTEEGGGTISVRPELSLMIRV